MRLIPAIVYVNVDISVVWSAQLREGREKEGMDDECGGGGGGWYEMITITVLISLK